MSKQRSNKQRFVRAMIKGWKDMKLKHLVGHRGEDGSDSACALGAAAAGMGFGRHQYNRLAHEFKFSLGQEYQIADTSNTSKTKAEAMRRIKTEIAEW